MTVEALLALYLRHHLEGKVSASYYHRLARQVFPPINGYPADAVPHLVLLEWWRTLWDRPGHANKALGFWRAAHRWAQGMGLIQAPDPTVGLVKRPEAMRSTTTSPEEWARVVPLLEDLKFRHRVYFWSLYLLGDRPTEIRTLRPGDLQLDRDIPMIVRGSSKNGRPYAKPLPEQLVPLYRLLLITTPPGAHWLFWGQTPDVCWCRTSVQKLWQSIRAKAGLPHLWLNDLRRSTASDLLNAGESLGIVQGALHHRSLSQTAKYAWLAVQPLSAALQRRADTIILKSTQ